MTPALAASTNGRPPGAARADRREVSTYEALRLEVLDDIAATKVDGRDLDAVAAVVRVHVDRYQRIADSGTGRRFAKPDEIAARLIRSIVGAGPFQKFIDQPDRATEVM